MVAKHTRRLIESYLTLIIWFMIHQEEDILSEQFKAVLEEIGSVEAQLRMYGLSQSAIDRLFDYADELYKTPVDQLSENAQLRMCKIVFGTGTHWSDDPHPLSKASEKGEDAKTV